MILLLVFISFIIYLLNLIYNTIENLSYKEDTLFFENKFIIGNNHG